MTGSPGHARSTSADPWPLWRLWVVQFAVMAPAWTGFVFFVDGDSAVRATLRGVFLGAILATMLVWLEERYRPWATEMLWLERRRRR
jgi:hypothetical protein